MNVTIKDIAELAGVSYSTVSKALNDSPLVKKKTKEKILVIAEELGYSPNFAAKRLVSKKSNIIGLIWPTINRVVLSSLVSKISEEMNNTAYSMILSVDPVHKAIDTFKTFQVDGIILFEEHIHQPINPGSIPLVSYGVGRHAPYDIIDPNHELAMHEAIRYLYRLGHTNIAYIGYISVEDSLQMSKYNGYISAMENLGIPINHRHIIQTNGLDWYDGYVAVQKILGTNVKPTAIISGSYDITSGVIRGLKEQNVVIPKDISVISYDNIPQMANMEVPMTCVGIPIDHLAKEIVRSIIHQIEGNEFTEQSVKSLQPVLTERTSCAFTNA